MMTTWDSATTRQDSPPKMSMFWFLEPVNIRLEAGIEPTTGGPRQQRRDHQETCVL